MSNPSPTFLTPTPLLISSSPTRSCTRVSTPKCVAGPSQHPLQSLLSVLNPFQTRPAPPSTHSVPENETLERTDGLAERLHARDDSDGLKQRLAARRNRVTVTHSKPEETRALPSPQKRRRNPSKRSSAYGIPELRAYALVEEAVRRKGRPEDGDISSLIPYDLQRELFDELIAGKNDVQEEEDNDDDGWVRGAWRAAGDAFRFVRGEQKGETKSRREEERGKVPAVAVAAMAHDVISDGDDGTSAAAAYAAAAAIATNATVKEVDERELRGLRQAVTAARAVANVEDANVFVATVGVGSLVAAARLLPGRERAAALTALANIAIMLPKYRTQMLRVDHGRLGDVLKEVVSVSSRFKVQTGGIWHTEALVSGTHLLGSLTLARGAGAEFRRNVATDVELVRRLQRIAGGLKNGEPEGAARAARRALGILGVNTWRPRMPGQKGLRILCIDGGGTRAIMAFEALKQLKKLTGCEIHELFDIICGTSTGAIVAASIGIAHKSAEEVELLYRDMIGKIFAKHPVNGPKMLLTRAYYDTSVLETTLQRECGRGVFIDSLAEENMNRVFVVSSIMSRNPKELHLFRNYTYPLGHESRYDGTVEAQLWEGLRASSAAPTFFTEIRVNGELHADGAIVANNPTAVALHETKCMYPGVPIELLVSLGNGVTPASEQPLQEDLENEKKNMGWGDVVGSILASATSTEVVHHAMQDLFPKDKYFRFNPVTDSTQIDETHPDTLASFVKEAREYMEANAEDFDTVARILRPKTPTSLWRRFRDALGKELQELQNSAWDDDLYLPN